MADTAAFFANKKKKKKAFKFNANKIDASTVTQTVHVDAPALSTDSDAAAGNSTPTTQNATDTTTPQLDDAKDQWDDEALAANLSRKGPTPVVAAASTTELLDMKALDLKRSEQGDIAEKLRVEETKAQLAAAREGMEREAQRIKEEREKQEQAKQETAGAGKPRFGAAAAGMAAGGGMGGGKWLPPHMRSGGGMMARERMGMGGTSKQSLDTQDENLFPDLAAAEAIIENQKQQQPAFKAPKKTPVGAGATWGSRPKKVNPEPRKAESASPPETAQSGEPKAMDAAKKEEPAKAEPSPPAKVEASAAPAAAPKPIKPKKKKKKDLSTFKG